MSYRSLLVHLDLGPLCAQRTALAIAVARRMDGHLVGLAPTGQVDLPVDPGELRSLSEFSKLAWELLQERAEQAALRFRQACEGAGLRSYEALVDEDDAASSLLRHALCSDLCLLSQVDPATARHRQAQALLEQLLLQSPRPSLVLPYAGHFEQVGKRVLVAWDESREAARALGDALPLLRNADLVHVQHWTRAGSAQDSAALPRLNALRQWLCWQGVSAETHSDVSEVEIGAATLSRAADLDADLIVMGLYGHAAWAERLMGGCTQTMLESMTVPLLLSH